MANIYSCLKHTNLNEQPTFYSIPKFAVDRFNEGLVAVLYDSGNALGSQNLCISIVLKASKSAGTKDDVHCKSQEMR